MTFYRPTIKPKRKERMDVRQTPEIRSRGHGQWIRGRRCILDGFPGHVCHGRIECCHVRTGTDGGLGVKPSDFWAYPGCGLVAHLEQTVEGEAAFERKYNLSLKASARRYAAESPHKMDWLSLGRDPAKEGTDIAPRIYSTVERKSA
jgi:hypothetical protein